MPGKNWNSKTKTWSPIVGGQANDLAQRARELRRQGYSVSAIAKRKCWKEV